MLVGLIYWILSYFVPIYALDPNNNGISKIYNLLMMLFPNTALYFGYSNIALFEERGTSYADFNHTTRKCEIML